MPTSISSRLRAAYRIAARLAPRDPQWVYCQAFLQEESGNEKEQFDLLQQTVRLKPGSRSRAAEVGRRISSSRTGWTKPRDHYELAARASDKDSYLQAAFGLGPRGGPPPGVEQGDRVRRSALPRTYPIVRPPYQLLQKAYEALGQADKAAEVREAFSSGKFTDVPPVKDPLNDRLIGLSYSSTRLLKAGGTAEPFRISRPGDSGCSPRSRSEPDGRRISGTSSPTRCLPSTRTNRRRSMKH